MNIILILSIFFLEKQYLNNLNIYRLKIVKLVHSILHYHTKISAAFHVHNIFKPMDIFLTAQLIEKRIRQNYI